MRSIPRQFQWNPKKGVLIETREIAFDVKSADEVKKKLRGELASIIRQVKNLKLRAEEIKEMLTQLEGAGVNPPAP